MAQAVGPESDRGAPGTARCDAADSAELVREYFVRLGDRWSLIVFQHLAGEPVRYTVLMERIPGISHRMLAKTLKQLERDGLASRTAYATVPPRVEYRLTDLGFSLADPLLALVGWVQANRPAIETSRSAYDS